MITFRTNYGLFFFLLFIPILSIAGEWVEVTRVYDGDTIQVRDGRHIRLLGINAPEVNHKGSQARFQKAEPFGEQAKQYVTKEVLGQKVSFEWDHENRDHYNRVLAYVFLLDGTFVNEKMLEQGLAYCLPKSPNNRYGKRLLRVQQAAMDSQRGLWQGLSQKPRQTYIGNKNSKRFHQPACRFGRHIHPKNRVIFHGIWDGFYNGYAPCKKCVVLQ